MQCGICSAKLNHREASCAACARAELYPRRIRHAQILFERECVSQQVGSVVSSAQHAEESQHGNTAQEAKPNPAKTSAQFDRIKSDISESSARIEEATQQAAALREQMTAYKKEIEDRRNKLRPRRDDLKSARTALEVHRREALEPVKYDTKKTKRRLEAVYKETVSARVYLCRSSASLAGLSRFPDPTDSSGNAFEYYVGGICLPDIRYMNNVEPEQVTASLTNTVRLLCLICNYLHVRLPAEITLPHRDYPLPTIYSPASSYSPGRPPMPFPAPATSSSSNPLVAGLVTSSPKTSRIFDQLQANVGGRPRPLFLDRKLSRLVREDPAAYAHFVEGVALLAWDVAWLCRTQGVVVASSDWADVCRIGRNLWELAVGPRRPGLSRRNTPKTGLAPDKEKDRSPKGGELESPKSRSKDKTSDDDKERLPNSNILGVFSHGSTLNFLHGSNAPSAYTPPPALNVPPLTVVDVSARGWKFASPVKVLHELKAALAAEMSGLDWEVLDGVDEEELMREAGLVEWQDKNEVQEEEEDDTGGVMVNGGTSSLENSPSRKKDNNPGGATQKMGTRAWYRLRARNEEP